MKYLRNYILLLLISAMIFSCSQEKVKLTEGNWRGVVKLNKDITDSDMPFLFTFETGEGKPTKVTIINAEERVLADEISLTSDSLIIKLPPVRRDRKAV